MDSSILPMETVACSFWTATLNFTSAVSARHFCLLGNNRYASPTTFGGCNDPDPDTGFVCRTCLPWDENDVSTTTTTRQQDAEQNCYYVKGLGSDLGMVPPSAGYENLDCPLGYEKFSDVLSLEVGCPVDSVMVLELFPTTTLISTPITTTTRDTTSVASNAGWQEIFHEYDFTVQTPDDVTREFEAHQCLTGSGGRNCGKDPLTFLAFHNDGHCQVNFTSGFGYKVQCDNGFQDSSSFLGGIRKQSCQASNGFSCVEVTASGAAAKATTTEITIIEGGGILGVEGAGGLCGIDEPESLNNMFAWLLAGAFMLLTLTPSFYYWRTGTMSPIFLVGLLSEALKNGAVVSSLASVDWSCLQQYGLFVPTGSHAILLPYALIAFSLADSLFTVIAMLARSGKVLEESVDKFKWVESSSTLWRRIMTFLNIVIIGGLGGFCQLALILEGTVDNPDGDNSLDTWSSWVFLVSASIGGFVGTVMLLVGVYTGNMRLAWKTYKVLVGDIPGTVGSIDLALALSPGWVAETLNDLVHLILYLPSLVAAYKTTSS